MVGNKKAPVGALLIQSVKKLFSFVDLLFQVAFAGLRVQKLIPNILVSWQG